MLLNRLFNSFFKHKKTTKDAQNNQSQQAVSDKQAMHRLQVNREELIALRFQSAGLDFNPTLSGKKKAHSMLAGGHLSPFKGRGMDFDEVRPYQPGDDIRNIDWNVTARTNRVHTKIFKEERERPVFVIVDFRSNMNFATRGSLKSVQAARLAVLSAWITANQHNRIGGVIFDDFTQVECRPTGGSKGVLKLINQLAISHNNSTADNLSNDNDKNTNKDKNNYSYQQEFTPNNLFKRIKKIVKPGSLLVFISDFDFLNDANLKHLHYLARHNDLVTGFVYDPLDVELPPPGQYSITQKSQTQQQSSIENKQQEIDEEFSTLDTSDTNFRQSYRQQFLQHDDYLSQSFKKIGAHFLRLATNESAKDSLVNLLGQRQRSKRVS